MTTPWYFQYKEKKSVPHTPDTILSRGKMNFPQTVILVVEGPDDKNALQGIVDEKTCDVEFLEGKQKVFECLKKVNEQKRGNIVGLVDSDYEKILKEAGTPPPISIMKYLFYTDTHDMNTMVATSRAFLKVLKLYYPAIEFESDKGEKIRKHAVTITQQIGLVRCLSSDKKYPERFNFKEDLRLDPFNIQQYIDIPAQKAKLEVILAAVKKDLPPEKRHELCHFITEKYPEELKARYPKEDLAWQLCQGHDLFSVLYTLLLEEGYLESSFDEFSTMLFDQFGIEELKESGKILHRRIKEWELRANKEGKSFRIIKSPN
jgi:hypothetical protein